MFLTSSAALVCLSIAIFFRRLQCATEDHELGLRSLIPGKTFRFNNELWIMSTQPWCTWNMYRKKEWKLGWDYQVKGVTAKMSRSLSISGHTLVMESPKLGSRVEAFREEYDSNNLTLWPSLGDSITKVWPEIERISDIFAVTPFNLVESCSLFFTCVRTYIQQ